MAKKKDPYPNPQNWMQEIADLQSSGKWKQAIDTTIKHLTEQQVADPSHPLVSALTQLIGNLDPKTAAAEMKNLPGNLSSLVTAGLQAGGPGAPQQGAAGPAKPIWDPLALQAMWANVFQPYLTQVNKIQGGSGQAYQQAMNQLIAGSNQPAAAKAQQTDQSNAMAQILQQANKSGAQGVAAQPSYDALLYALQQAAGAAQLYQGEAQKAIAYGTNLNAAQAFGSGGAGSTGTAALSPTQQAALLNGAIAGSQTTNPFQPTAPPSAVTGLTNLP